MAKASLNLPDGTKVSIEGSPEEIKRILALHYPQSEIPDKVKKTQKIKHGKGGIKQDKLPDITELVNTFKECDEIKLIEENILDRTSQVDRILLPMYITNKYISSRLGLTSTEIMQFLSELGITMFQSNIATKLSGTASKYVMGDKIRKRGPGGVRYRLSRRGLQYLESVIKGKSNG